MRKIAGLAVLAVALTSASAVSATGAPSRIAVLPVSDMTQRAAPLEQIQARVMEALHERAVSVIAPEPLADALARIRFRYSGGVTNEEAKSLRELTGADAVLVTTLEAFEMTDPPLITLGARLVSVDSESASPLWADAVMLVGDESTGAFERKRIFDPEILLQRAVDRIASGLAAFLGNAGTGARQRPPEAHRRFAPRSLYVAPGAPSLRSVRRVAVVPFMNASTRPYAGEIVAAHMVRELLRMGGVEVVEPGRVRQVILDTRLIQDGGISLAQADVLSGILEADLVISGRVQEFAERLGGGPPVVAFNTYAVDVSKRSVVWVARTYASGREGVRFFDLGEIRSASRVAQETVRSMLSEVGRR